MNKKLNTPNTHFVLFRFLLLMFFCFGFSSLGFTQTQTGTASYYGAKFHGRKTSSGERFHKDSLTAAHHTLPFGTYIKVTNLKNNDTVIVRVNDRIAHKKRLIDLSPAAARKLGFIKDGTAKVKVEVIKKPTN
jgi:rare lipoprotein A